MPRHCDKGLLVINNMPTNECVELTKERVEEFNYKTEAFVAPSAVIFYNSALSLFVSAFSSVENIVF